MVSYEIVDYEGEIVADGFETKGQAYFHLLNNYTSEFIQEMNLKIQRKEEKR